jgi:trimeric autotransporter adhesin
METNNMTTLHLRKSSERSPLRLGLPRVQPIWIIRGFLLIPLALNLFAVPPTARAEDGGLPNDSTAEGINALVNQNNSGFGNTAMGWNALGALTGASFNTATGYKALLNNNGDNNTADGSQALANNTNGFWNTATGANALLSNTTGSANTADGYGALSSNTNGGNNTAMGYTALASLAFDGIDNTAIGAGALFSNTSGADNTAIGFNALFKNTAANNTAVGGSALLNNINGTENTATGAAALFKNTSGNNNTADGFEALFSNTTGSNNTAHGLLALENNTIGHDNIAEGFQALANNTTGSSNIALGSNAGINLTTGSNNIDVGAPGTAGESRKIRIGKQGTQVATFIAGIYNVNEGGTIKPLFINSNGQLGTQAPASSRRFKKEIKPMDQTSEAILGLKPVTFQYKSDSTATPQFGLIAEEVAKINPDLVVRDEDGEIYTVRYEAVNAMLLNEFLKEHRVVQDQQGTIGELRSDVAKEEAAAAKLKQELQAKIAQQQKQIEALTAAVQKVSNQLELGKPALRTAENNQ